MFGPVRAVIIDDTPSHLLSISSGFSAACIPCTPYWYDRSEISLKNKLKPRPPEGGHKYLRVIFTDLNLDETKPVLAEAIGPVINIISQLVSTDGGPYAIVFWTVMQFKIEDIRFELNERLMASDIPLPIAVDEIAKGPFLSLPSKEKSGEEVLEAFFTEAYEKSPGLKDKVLEILEKYGLLCMVSEWESRASHAAGQSTNKLFAAAGVGAAGGANVTETFQKVCALVAKEAAGQESAKQQPAKAYDVAMQDILTDSFSHSVNEPEYSKIVEKQLKDLISNKFEVNNSEQVYACLNSMFHIDANVVGVNADERGAVVDIAVANKAGLKFDSSSFCCWDELFWEPREDDIEVVLPRITPALISGFHREVEAVDKGAARFAIKAATNLRATRNREVKERYTTLKTDKQRFVDSVGWVLIEAGADCDHAQNKPRTLRYLLAAKIPAGYVKSYVYGGTKGDLRSGALKILGPYMLEGELSYILVSLRRFVAWQPPENPPTVTILYRFRKSIVDYLLNSYASWSMRPGITEYKP
jgi:hypothetical protein